MALADSAGVATFKHSGNKARMQAMPLGKCGYAYTLAVEHGAGLVCGVESGIFHGNPLEEMNDTENTGTNELSASAKSSELTRYGERIRWVRRKRKLSQGEFAELAGVTVRAQRNYEAGIRTPNLDYLSMLAIADVDIGYILTGLESRMTEKADADALVFLSEHLGLSFMHMVNLSAAISEFRHGHIDQTELDQRIVTDLAAFRVGVLDADLLASILEAIDQLSPSLPTRKKSGVASLLYRAFRATGYVDIKAVKEAVDLAS